MPYIVKEADVLKDRNIMLNILKNNRTGSDSVYEKRYDWLYFNNPDGKAIPWIIWDEKNSIPVGFTAVFPRRMLIDGKETICWNCGDFSIETKYRSLGIAMQLRKEAKKEVDNGRVSFLYAHPNDRMKVVHLKAGHHQLGLMQRHALPLRIDDYFQSKLNNEMLANMAAFPVNQLLKLNLILRKKNTKLEAVFCNTPEFSDKHESLFSALAEKYRVIGIRDRTYLTWKFIDHPNFQFMLMNFYSGDELVGYIIFSGHDSVANIVDCVVHPENLLQDIVILFLKKIRIIFPETISISAVTFESNPLTKAMKQLNFRYRDDATSAVITYASPESKLNAILYQKDNWFLTVGDRDA